MNFFKKESFIAIFFILFASQIAFAENNAFYLDNGVALFRIGNYSESINNFKKILNNKESDQYQADAYFWISKSYIATDQLDEAEKSLEAYLLKYPKNQYYEEAVYQKGRLLYLQRDYENCIQECENFIENYPGSIFIANAYFWLGETLYTLGRLEDAEIIFKKIIEEYPASFKVKDSKYRMIMIDQKFREQSLIELLKLTHEEYYKAIEELQLREKTYETAIDSYQKRLIAKEMNNSVETENQDPITNEIISLKNQLGEKNVEILALKKKITELEYRLSDYELEKNNTATQDNQGLSTDAELELLKLENRAQKIRNYYLEYLDNDKE